MKKKTSNFIFDLNVFRLLISETFNVDFHVKDWPKLT